MADFRLAFVAFGVAASGSAFWPLGATAQSLSPGDAQTVVESEQAVGSANSRYAALGEEMLRLNDRLASLERIIVQLVSRQDESDRSLASIVDELARLRAKTQTMEMAASPLAPPIPMAEAGRKPTPLPPTEPRAVDRFDQAMLFVERQEWANAELALTTFIANKPDDVRIKEARYRLGLVYLEQKQAGQAARIFIDLFETGPPAGLGAENLFALARALRELGTVDPAQICSVYSEIEVAYGGELSEERGEELLDLRLSSACGQ